MTREKLIVKETSIHLESGRYVASIAMTARAVELADNDGFDNSKESWLEYRNRTKLERDVEEDKRIQLARDLVQSYNEKFGL